MIADEKTIMELYAPPFEAVASTVAGYMCRCEVRRIWRCCVAVCAFVSVCLPVRLCVCPDALGLRSHVAVGCVFAQLQSRQRHLRL